MIPMSFSKLAQVIDAQPTTSDVVVNSISTDSRNIKPGDCFFAIEGAYFDGHQYIDSAFEKGAVCAVVNKDYPSKSFSHCEEASLMPAWQSCILKVDDTIKALGHLAAYYRRQCSFKVIAITGSVGKTTTRHMITHVLAEHYNVYQSPKNFNNEIGLPITLLSADPDDEIIVAEIGANAPGEISYLSNIAAPDIAMVTNAQPAHLEGFGSLETIIKEKLSIADGLKPGSPFLLNADCRNLIDQAQADNREFITFDSSELDLESLNLPLPGKGNLQNALAAWAVCSRMGITKEQFIDSIRTLKPVPGRSQVKKFGSVTVIDDCYNANPASMKNALDILSLMSAKNNSRAVFICGDMLELGTESEKLHAELGNDVINAGVDTLITVGPLAKLTAVAARNISPQKLCVDFFENAELASDNLHKFVKDNDIVLVKASRSIALEKVVEKLKILFKECGNPGF